MSADEIRLDVPAQAAYGRVARVAAANLASRRGFTLGEIDDLRLAMDEAAVMLLGQADAGGRLVVRFDVEEDSLTVTARVEDATVGITREGVERFTVLVGDLIDSFDVDRPAHRLQLVKKASGSAGSG